MSLSLGQLAVMLQILGITSGTIPSGALLAVNNLNDVNDKPTSRTNLVVPAAQHGAGNPNGTVAGSIGDFWIRTDAGNQLWYCTTAGTTSTAVWIVLPSGTSAALLSANDLNDVASVITSRANLGVSAISSYAGDPNGHVAGAVNDWVRDISNQTIWICTTAGTSTTAVWEAIGGQGDLLAANDLSDVNNTDNSRQNLNAPKISSYPGDPNGHVAGIEIGDLCLNTLKSALYVCTTTGTAIAAVWTAVINQAQKFVDNAVFCSTFGIAVGSTPTPLPAGEIASSTMGSTWSTVGDNYGMKCGQQGNYWCVADIPLSATGLSGGATYFYIAVNGVKASKSFPMGNVGTINGNSIVLWGRTEGLLDLNFGDIVTIVGITNSINPLITYYNSPDSDGLSITFLRQS